MKKIIAILISFLFVASTLSFASATVNGWHDCCDPANFDISTTSVKVGETFTVYHYSWGCTPTITEGEDLVEKIQIDVYWNGTFDGSYDPKIQYPPSCPECWFDVTYRAVKPGKVVFSVPNSSNCNGKVEVTIKSRALPMDKFFKLFGFGKKKE